MSDNTSRRNFVRSSGAAAAFLIVKPESVRGSQANSALSVGLIGCGGRGTYVSGLFVKNEFAKVTAVCDIYRDKLDAAGKSYSGAAQYTNHQELLASNVDAVLIATPAFLHPEHFEAAVKARKHIYMEKPAGLDFRRPSRFSETSTPPNGWESRRAAAWNVRDPFRRSIKMENTGR